MLIALLVKCFNGVGCGDNGYVSGKEGDNDGQGPN